jgi:putative copper resistance protein D
MDELLIGARIIHFAATVSVAGGVLFRCLIADPALSRAGANAEPWRSSLKILIWPALVLAVLSGAAWLFVVAANLGGEVGRVLADTRIGHVWLMRLGLAVLLAFSLGRAWLSAVLAAGLLGSLAWSGHAGAAPGTIGALHLAVDVVHLLAAGAWLGGLLPLWLLLRRQAGLAALFATERFTALGMWAVGVLLVSGILNACLLLGSPTELVTTTYGQLLLIKIALFAAMVAIAAVNRLRLTPRLPAAATTRGLMRNVLAETVLGLAILAVVSVLGTLPPAGAHMVMHMGMHLH